MSRLGKTLMVVALVALCSCASTPPSASVDQTNNKNQSHPILIHWNSKF